MKSQQLLLVLAGMLIGGIPVHLAGQNRDFNVERILLDDDGTDGGWNSLTVQTPNPLPQNSVLTIPDPGAGAAFFLLSESLTPQTVNADMTFTGTVNFSAASLSGISLLSDGTTLLGDGTTGDEFRINLANPNNWTGTQTFADVSVTGLLSNGGSGNPLLRIDDNLRVDGLIRVDNGGGNDLFIREDGIGKNSGIDETIIFANAGGGTLKVVVIDTVEVGVELIAGNDVMAGDDVIAADDVEAGEDVEAGRHVQAGDQLQLVADNGTNMTTVAAGAQGADINYTLPPADGADGDVLKTDGSGTLSWANPSLTLSHIGGIATARKTVDESTTSGSLQNDDDLSIALNANQVYEVYGLLYALKGQFLGSLLLGADVPAGSTMKVSFHSHFEDGNLFGASDIITGDGVAASQSIPLSQSDRAIIIVSGIIETGGTAGDMTIQWGMTSAGGGRTVTVETNSFVKVTRIE